MEEGNTHPTSTPPTKTKPPINVVSEIFELECTKTVSQGSSAVLRHKFVCTEHCLLYFVIN